ncbi:MAG: ankyrin repeat domain-containing protein [Candidatus Babeliales bacterium]
MQKKYLILTFFLCTANISSAVTQEEWFKAIEDNDLTKINNILNAVKTDQANLIEVLSWQDTEEQTGLIAALQQKKINIANTILDAIKLITNEDTKKNIINARNVNSYTALYYALENNSLFNELKDTDLNLQYENGDTLLHQYAGKLNFNNVNFLITNNANPNIENDAGQTPLMKAILSGKPAPAITGIVGYLLEEGKADPLIKDNSEKTAFDYAQERGLANTKALLEKYTPTEKIKKDEWFKAIENNDLTKVNEILDAVKNDQAKLIEVLSWQNDNGQTGLRKVLTYASDELYSQIINTILDAVDKIADKNAKQTIVNTPDNSGLIALFPALLREKDVITNKLIAMGADINFKNKDGDTPLHLLAANFNGFKFLLNAGANPNITNNDGNTPLIRVVLTTNTDKNIAEIAKILLDKGADPLIQNNEDKTALDYAQERGLTDTANILKPAPAPAPTPVNYQALYNSITNLSNQLTLLYNKLQA